MGVFWILVFWILVFGYLSLRSSSGSSPFVSLSVRSIFLSFGYSSFKPLSLRSLSFRSPSDHHLFYLCLLLNFFLVPIFRCILNHDSSSSAENDHDIGIGLISILVSPFLIGGSQIVSIHAMQCFITVCVCIFKHMH